MPAYYRLNGRWTGPSSIVSTYDCRKLLSYSHASNVGQPSYIDPTKP